MFINMDNQSRILIIADIDSFINTQLPLIIETGFNYRLNNEEEIDYFLDWSVNQILTDEYQMQVIHHYRHDIFKCIYSELKYSLTRALSRCVILNDLVLFKGCQVKTLINDRDLFITRRVKYKTVF